MSKFWRKLWKKILHHFIPAKENTFRPHLLRKSWLIFFLTVVCTAEAVVVAGIFARQAVLSLPAAVVPAEIISLTNAERQSLRAPLLLQSERLTRSAQAKAEDMAAKGYFSHNGPDGKEPWRWIEEAGYAYRIAGENLAVRFEESSDVVRAWMASPTHRDNIARQGYAEIGIGVAEGTYKGERATFVVQHFGTPREAPVQAVLLAESEEIFPGEEPGSPLVEGAATGEEEAPTTSASIPEETLVSDIALPSPTALHQVGETVANASASSTWVIGAVLLLLMLLLALAFFIHIEIQSHDMLMGGALVAGVALLFVALNVQLPSMQNQTASVGSLRPNVLVGEEAVFIEYAATSSEILDLQQIQQTPEF